MLTSFIYSVWMFNHFQGNEIRSYDTQNRTTYNSAETYFFIACYIRKLEPNYSLLLKRKNRRKNILKNSGELMTVVRVIYRPVKRGEDQICYPVQVAGSILGQWVISPWHFVSHCWFKNYMYVGLVVGQLQRNCWSLVSYPGKLVRWKDVEYGFELQTKCIW